MKLRPYQSDLRDQALNSFDGSIRRVLLQSVTGSGKTVTFSSIADHYIGQGYPVLMLAHRKELLYQAKSKLQALTGHPVGIIQSGTKPDYSAPIQVASIQSLANRLDKIGHHDFALVVTDECHHATSKTYRNIFNHFDSAFHLGCSATPKRLDGQGFDDLYDELICGPSVEQLIADGYLCDFKLFADYRPMKVGRKTAGDYNTRDVADKNDAIELSGKLIDSYRHHCPNAKAVVFAINIQHSQQIAQQYNEAGIPAAHLDGSSGDTERTEILEAFAKGQIRVLSNVNLFDEGFDCPDIEAIQVARPTASLVKHLQMLGRALRPAEGKDYATFLDHTNNWKIHGTPKRKRCWSLEGISRDEDTRVTRRNHDGEVIEAEPPKIVEVSTNLVQIDESDISNNESTLSLFAPPVAPGADAGSNSWAQYGRALVNFQRMRGYKPGWVGYQLKGCKFPPLFECWQAAGEALGYHPGWARHQYQDACEAMPKSSPKVNRDYSSLNELWKAVLEQVKPFGTKVLFRQQGRLLGFIRDDLEAVVEVRSTLFRMASDRIENLAQAFSSVVDADVCVCFVVENQYSPLREMVDKEFVPLSVSAA